MTIIPTPDSAGYITLPVTVDPNALLASAFASIAAQLPGWVPREGHLEVAILEELAQMMSETAAVAAQVPVSIFRYFGGLVGITPITGTPATTPVTFTMTGSAGYTIPSGTVVAYPVSGTTQLLFTVQSDLVIPAGSTTGTGTLVCETAGTFANNQPAATCQMVTTMASVASVATTATTSGGVDPESTNAYINRLSDELQLLAPRPILASDYAAMAQNVSGVDRALAINGLWPGRTDTGCGTTSASPTVTDTSIVATDVGRSVTETNVPASSYVGVVSAGVSFGLSSSATSNVPVNATATGTGLSMVLGDLTGQQRCVTVSGVDVNGVSLPATVESALQSYLASKREVNFIVSVINPTFTAIDVTVSLDAVHGQSAASVQTAVTAALQNFLSPANWGGGNLTPPSWTPTSNIVRFLDIANVIRSTFGVLYIPSGSLSFGIHGSALGVVDVTLPGDAPLTNAGTLSVTVTAT